MTRNDKNNNNMTCKLSQNYRNMTRNHLKITKNSEQKDDNSNSIYKKIKSDFID